jgi:hypothetical protein
LGWLTNETLAAAGMSPSVTALPQCPVQNHGDEATDDHWRKVRNRSTNRVKIINLRPAARERYQI